jgi:hypothetical protein
MADTKTTYILLPEVDARMINGSLFERDIYKDLATGKEGDPRYKAQVAFADTEENRDALNDIIVKELIAEWGESAEEEFFEGKISDPLRNGDKLKAAREAKGKSGDAFGGMIVLSADTKYNRNGDDAEGGVAAFDEMAEVVPMLQKDKFYNGCFVKLSVTVSCWEGTDRTGKFRAVKFYLQGVQFVKDGERLRATARNPFSQQVRDAGEGGRERKRQRKT